MLDNAGLKNLLGKKIGDARCLLAARRWLICEVGLQ